VSRGAGSDPEHEALRLDSVGLALLVVLATLPPAELGDRLGDRRDSRLQA
jgi:hypothetical protein